MDGCVAVGRSETDEPEEGVSPAVRLNGVVESPAAEGAD
jgi:hypothetical protein